MSRGKRKPAGIGPNRVRPQAGKTQAAILTQQSDGLSLSKFRLTTLLGIILSLQTVTLIIEQQERMMASKFKVSVAGAVLLWP